MADHSYAITLTYGRDQAGESLHERSVVLTYSDFQKYMKLLRRHGYDVRYFVTGEYGSLNGRAHWHAMLYFNGGHPGVIRRQNFMERHWPHGWSFWDDKPDYAAIRYCVKYVIKRTDDAGKQAFGPIMSKKPPVGAAYFRERAEQFVRQGLAPQSLEYSFPDVRFRKRNGKEEVMRFWLKKRSAEMFLDHYLGRWLGVPDAQHWAGWLDENGWNNWKRVPNSELLEEYADRFAGERLAELRDAEGFDLMANRAKKYSIHDLDDWFTGWIREAKNEQERKARKAEYERWAGGWDAGPASSPYWNGSREADEFRERAWPEVDWDYIEQVAWENGFDQNEADQSGEP